jgi:acetyl-CoA carboxylase carboxyltransferase component
MARGKRKVSTEAMDAKIEQQKAALEKAKAKYEAEKDELTHLIKLRNEMRKEELMDAVIKSDHTYAEIMAFIKESEEMK